jgi:hypothetical protein
VQSYASVMIDKGYGIAPSAAICVGRVSFMPKEWK